MDHKFSYVEFYNGQKMPTIGLGTFQTKSKADEDEAVSAVNAALEIGYRHIDTAYLYQTEEAIGKALQKWFSSGKLKREEVFIVTKLPSWGMRAESVEKYLKESLKALQLTYVDLYLIHHPVGLIEVDGDNFKAYQNRPTQDFNTDHIKIWKAMEKQVDAGRTRSIGLSNFNARQIKRIVKSARIKPANVQVEAQIYCQQKELVAFCKAFDITVCAFGPIGSSSLKDYVKNKSVPDLSPLADPVVNNIAKKYNRSPAQILLRHLIQNGLAVIPKSSKPNRIKENYEALSFELQAEDMATLNALDKRGNGRIFTAEVMPAYVGHPENPFNDPY